MRPASGSCRSPSSRRRTPSAGCAIRCRPPPTYRYTSTVAPTTEATQTCSMAPFVERKWNREFVWVQIPQTGNVTVPEDYYDRFTGKMGTEPPNYSEACKVLVEAAAADLVVPSPPPISIADCSPVCSRSDTTPGPGSESRALFIRRCSPALPRGGPGPIAVTGSDPARTHSIGRTCSSGYSSRC